MPILEVHTNMSAKEFPSDFHVKLAEAAAPIFKRPQNVMIVGLYTDERLSLGSGDSEPVFLLQVSNADAFQDVDENRCIIKALSDYLTDEMAVPPSSIRILLVSLPSTQIGLPRGNLLSDVIEERQNATNVEQPAQE